MMDHYVSEPLGVPSAPKGVDISRADLVFYDVDHSGPSFEARIFFNNESVTHRTPLTPDEGYAGSFHVFGHGGCFGDEGHCQVGSETRDQFDLRPPHPLIGQTKTVIVTEAVRRLADPRVVISVVPVTPGTRGAVAVDALSFERLRLLIYESSLES
jgi:tyrosinase